VLKVCTFGFILFFLKFWKETALRRKSGEIEKEGARIPPSIAGLMNGNHEQDVRGRTPDTCTDYAPIMGKRYMLYVDKIIMLIKNI